MSKTADQSKSRNSIKKPSKHSSENEYSGHLDLKSKS